MKDDKKIVFYLNSIVYCRQSLNHAKGNLSKFGHKTRYESFKNIRILLDSLLEPIINI